MCSASGSIGLFAQRGAAKARCDGHGYTRAHACRVKAWMPVMYRPRMRLWMSWVPS